MAKVEIRLEDTNLLKWFNQVHAALLTADKSIWVVIHHYQKMPYGNDKK